MHPIGTKVIHLLTGDYGFVVDTPQMFNTAELPEVFKDSWVLWLTGKETAGKVLWEQPKMLYAVELEK